MTKFEILEEIISIYSEIGLLNSLEEKSHYVNVEIGQLRGEVKKLLKSLENL